MAEKLEDLNLPLSVVSRIAKEALGDGVSVSKEARVGLAKVASVFVLYVTSASTNRAEKDNRKTVTGKDVLNAMNDIELERFAEPLGAALEAYRAHARARKAGSAPAPPADDAD